MAVELYHFRSSVCSVWCRMALDEKGVPWTSRYIDLFKFDQMQPEYLAVNPRGMVPTLVHDGKPVRESSIINEYDDAVFAGPPITPSDPLRAARMREFVYLCDEGFSAIVKLTMVKYILPKLRNRWSDDELRKQAEPRPTQFYRDVHGRAVRGEITSKNSAMRVLRLKSCLTILSRRSFLVRGSSAASTPSLKSRSRPTCFASPRLAALGADRASMHGTRTSPDDPPSRQRCPGRMRQAVATRRLGLARRSNEVELFP
jgi:Glutathione S-transferase, N-terminal domain